MSETVIESPEETKLRKELAQRTDAEALRMERFLEMPDLSRTEGSPLREIVTRASQVPSLRELDVIKIPEIISSQVLFDLFNMPPGHPARSKSDTYYVNDNYVLRTHDTVFWYYYLNHPDVKKRIANKETIGALCHGKVYRKDEIDARHSRGPAVAKQLLRSERARLHVLTLVAPRQRIMIDVRRPDMYVCVDEGWHGIGPR